MEQSWLTISRMVYLDELIGGGGAGLKFEGGRKTGMGEMEGWKEIEYGLDLSHGLKVRLSTLVVYFAPFT